MSPETHPFAKRARNPMTGHPFVAQTVEERLDMVPRMTREQCEQALAMPDLQSTVANAVRRRLKSINLKEEA